MNCVKIGHEISAHSSVCYYSLAPLFALPCNHSSFNILNALKACKMILMYGVIG